MRRIWCTLYLTPLLAAMLTTGCAGRSRVQAALPLPIDKVAVLSADLDRIFSDPAFSNAQWGVEILSLDRGEVLYERNSGKLLMPASNNKLLTAAAALVRLGPDFRFETRIATDGQIAGGALRGNLIVIGSGDPTISSRFWNDDPSRAFRDWAAKLKELGIHVIQGDLIGVDGAFESEMLGAGWEWDDLAYGTAAPVSALQYDDNLMTVEITPGSNEGDRASAGLPLGDSTVSIDCRIVTGAPGSSPDVRALRGRAPGEITLLGTVPWRNTPIKQAIAVDAPALRFLRAFRRAIRSEGIDTAATPERIVRSVPGESLTSLYIHRSPPLADIMKPLLKISQNLYAETLTKAMGRHVYGEGSHARGREAVEATLRLMALEPGSYSYADGSGLSRLNLVSPDHLVRLLKFMSRHEWFTAFDDALSVAGIDGTLHGRMKGTLAEGNVRAKTGSLANVRCLSGYIRTADGELLAFSMMANNFLVSNRSAEYVQDSALERLAAFSRK